MVRQADRRKITTNIWTARAIPFVLAGIVGYATYVVVALLCINYLLVKHDDIGAAAPILVVYFILFMLMAASFFRLVYVTAFDPPYVPMGPMAIRDRSEYNEKDRQNVGFSTDLDSPGLESFYTKDVFVCEMDGKPKWCSECANWKPDRAHHCSSSGRCIRKMDHFCPWVGGPIGENNFKFFMQFTGYTSLYCVLILVVMAIYIHRQRTTPDEKINSQFIAVLALAAFFGVFTGGMTGTSMELAVKNQTQVEKLGLRTRIYILAILKPSQMDLARIATSGNSQLTYPEITYPLGAGIVPPQDQWRHSAWLPSSKMNGHTHQAVPALASEPSRQAQELSGSTLSGSSERPPTTSSTLGTQPESMDHLAHVTHTSPLFGDSPIEPVAINPGSADGDTTTPMPLKNSWPNEEISARDLGATRTFAVLKMLEPGDNPWDLGSAQLNWETVMGTSLLDWFLPIRRSPCCKHEDSESHFLVGPTVDVLRAKFNFIPASEIRATGGPDQSRRGLSPSGGEKHFQPIVSGRESQKRRRRKSSHKRPPASPAQPDPPIILSEYAS